MLKGFRSSKFLAHRKRLWLALCALLMLVTVIPGMVWAQDITQVKKGVVKITAQVEGKTRVGSGIIVKLEGDHAYIVTASHVTEGDEIETVS